MDEKKLKPRKSILEWYREHPKTVFSIRFALWALFAAILPFVFIALRYGIFTNKSQIELSGWGGIAVLMGVVFLITWFKYLYQGLKPGLFKQCVIGFVGVILPLLILFLLIESIKSNINFFQQALGCVIICEAVGIPLNPFPTWVEKRKAEIGQEKIESASDVIWNKFFEKKKDNK